ncbi:putative 3-dehydroshikimate dehydratase [Diaporthe ampelina]|uniref:Putative 3-dehydroshikimate dehydratase n=1 Tax=Diaporthe ampelina TaxID=1214573 RepID=A0A0G2F7B1_9PEZI|nr:putative 3-dehydroshikimate dehydratase [Diaporthe ampelina]
MDVSMTTVSSHVETQISDTEVAIIQTQDTEVMLSQPDVAGEDKEIIGTDEKAATIAGDVVSAAGELESDAESVKNGRAASHDEAQLDKDEDLAMSEAASEPLENEIVAVSSPPQPADQEEAEESKTASVAGKEAAPALSDEEDYHDASELLQVDESPSVAHFDDRASFVTANSQASESRETEEAESPSVRKSKRSTRIRALREGSGIQLARPPRASKRGTRVPSDQSPSPRTTRSQTMSFQKTTSPTHEQEDMFARAGLRSPTRRKTSATSANKAKAKNDLVKRLGTEMPECAPLKDLKSYNMNTLDVVAVVTSTNTTPQRTKARQYVSSFTVSDPSTAPQGVIEVSLFRAHKDYLPVVKPGDSILLRRFTVTSLPGRGFGLRTEDESSWAVFNTDGEDAAPQVRGPPVELSEKEKNYLVEMRAWYAALDEGAKEKLAAAVGEIVQRGKESRGEK